jgi:hypothetical protein
MEQEITGDTRVQMFALLNVMRSQHTVNTPNGLAVLYKMDAFLIGKRIPTESIVQPIALPSADQMICFVLDVLTKRDVICLISVFPQVGM